MSRYTTFEVDLALLGGQDRDSARALSWATFVEHWKAVLPQRKVKKWDFSSDRLHWVDASLAPDVWSTSLWPDCVGYPESGVSEERKPTTLLHMVIHDILNPETSSSCRKEARSAFEWLIASGVSPNVWPGHGSSAIALAALNAKVSLIQTMAAYGVDMRCYVSSGARPEFLGSSLLFRVAPGLAQKSLQSRKKATFEKNLESWDPLANNAGKTLMFLAKNTSEPNAPNNDGVTPLQRVTKSNPWLGNAFSSYLASQKEHALLHTLGVPEEEAERHLEAQSQWVAHGTDKTGQPIWLLEEACDAFGLEWPKRFREVPAGTKGAVVFRAFAVQTAKGPLEDAHAAQEEALQSEADALREPTQDGERWWLFDARQTRPGLCIKPHELRSPPKVRL